MLYMNVNDFFFYFNISPNKYVSRNKFVLYVLYYTNGHLNVNYNF